MQRLEIVWAPSLFGVPSPLTDEAHYWEINVKSCDDERYCEAVGYDNEDPGGQRARCAVLVGAFCVGPTGGPASPRSSYYP